MTRAAVLAMAVLIASFGLAGYGRSQSAGSITPIPKRCEAPGAQALESPALPNVVQALRDRKRIVILAIGGTSASLRGPVAGGYFSVVEQLLESTFKSLDVKIVHRGVSGELAADAARRIRNEVALTGADLVLWQVGTADAMARVDSDSFRESVASTIGWLKAHNIDVILVGMRYAKSLAKDPWYQSTRKVMTDIAKQQSILRISRYTAEETLAKVRTDQHAAPSDAEISEASYNCMAEYLARAIATGLFLRTPKPGERPARP